MMKTESRIRYSLTGPARTAGMGLLSLGLAGLLMLGGCNRAPAPAAAPGDTAASTPAAPPPAPATEPPPAAAPPAGTQPAPPPPAAGSAMMAQAPAAPPPAPRVYTVPSGSRIVVRVGQTISAKASNVGDSFSGTLSQSVVVKGVSIIRAGAPVTGTVTAAKGRGRFKGAGDLAIAVSRVGKYEVATSSYEAAAVKGKGKRTAGFIGGGGGGGALIGGLAGGGKGALIGGLLGAGAGTAGAALTGNKDITIPAESVVSFTLTSPITVTREP